MYHWARREGFQECAMTHPAEAGHEARGPRNSNAEGQRGGSKSDREVRVGEREKGIVEGA